MSVTKPLAWKLALSAVSAGVLGLCLVGGAQPVARAAESTPLETTMEDMNSAYKKLKKSIKDPAKINDSLASTRIMLETSIKSKAMEPKMAKDIPADKKAKFLLDYQKEMNIVIRDIIALEDAMIDGKAEEAQKLFDKLADLKKAGHDKFIKE